MRKLHKCNQWNCIDLIGFIYFFILCRKLLRRTTHHLNNNKLFHHDINIYLHVCMYKIVLPIHIHVMITIKNQEFNRHSFSDVFCVKCVAYLQRISLELVLRMTKIEYTQFIIQPSCQKEKNFLDISSKNAAIYYGQYRWFSYV